jgi:D-alanine-D-alanine ligase
MLQQAGHQVLFETIGMPMADSLFLSNGKMPAKDAMKKIGYPVFVKPNCHGSSFGISKASNEEELEQSCKFAYQFDDEILVESFMEGREFSCGVVRHRGKVIPLPVTEIISETEFFDFAAKYEQKSQEITPADLPEEQSDICRKGRPRYTNC